MSQYPPRVAWKNIWKNIHYTTLKSEQRSELYILVNGKILHGEDRPCILSGMYVLY
ncbi:pol-like protein [Anopheles sinensis]|uniref:Pol-like protein n=1 Tax=Anopheles sinensis TaxID=74873 RepID=A0A084VCK8_ANOSI|nr:pol-like protein [Anopheles sinensis]